MASIVWTKDWSSADDGTIIDGADLKNIQDDIASGVTTNATEIQSVPIEVPEASDDGSCLYYDHGTLKFDYVPRATILATTAPTVDIDGGTIDGTTIGLTVPAAGAFTTLKVGTTNQGDILYDNGTSIVRLPPGTAGQLLATQGAGANPLWSGGTFAEYGTYSAVTSVQITETIAEGEIVEIWFEGTTSASLRHGMTVNNDTAGSNYSYVLSGKALGDPGAGVTEFTAGSIAADEVGFNDPANPPNTGEFSAKVRITARNSDTQIAFEYANTASGNNELQTTNGVGRYDAGTPTTIEFIRESASGTFTGSYYVYRLRQA